MASPGCRPATHARLKARVARIPNVLYFDTNRLIAESFGEAGYPAPSQQFVVHGLGSAAGV